MSNSSSKNGLIQYLRVCADLAEQKGSDGLAYVSPVELRRAIGLLGADETSGCARCKEHEQFRHQHRNCDSLAVALQRIKLSAISLADAQVIALEALRGSEEPTPTPKCSHCGVSYVPGARHWSECKVAPGAIALPKKASAPNG